LWDTFYTRFFTKRKAGFAAVGLLPPEQLRGYLAELTHLMGQGKLRIVMDQEYLLKDAVAAHTYVDSGRKRGNVVLRMVDNRSGNHP